MSHGFKGKVREIVTKMDAQRHNGFDVNLRSFMAENYNDVNGKPLGPEHLFAELSLDPRRTKLHELMNDDDNRYLISEIVREGVRQGIGAVGREQLAAARASMAPITGEQSGGQRFVTPEVFLDPVNRGAVQGTFFQDLIIREELVDQPQAIVPKLDLSDAKLMDSDEAATIEEGSVTYSTKTVTLTKKAKAIKQTYESLQFSSLSMVQLFMMDLGRMLGHALNGMAVDTIVNGDQADLSEKAAVIGVESTGNGITYFDLTRVAIQFGLLGRTAVQVVGNPTTALNFINLSEVKNKAFNGNPLLPVAIKTPMSLPEELYASYKIPTNQLAFNDPSASLVQLTAQPLLVETEKLIMKQLVGTAISIYTGFAKIQRNASVVIDSSITYAANQFPAFMQPFQG